MEHEEISSVRSESSSSSHLQYYRHTRDRDRETERGRQSTPKLPIQGKLCCGLGLEALPAVWDWGGGTSFGTKV